MQDHHNLHQSNEPPISSLISGILRDASDLIAKEITAARLEMREELANIKSTAILMGIGAIALLLGGILLLFTIAHALNEYTDLKLWASFAIVTGVMLLIGIAVLLAGKQRAAKTKVVPTESIENAKEDARWITRSVKYETR